MDKRIRCALRMQRLADPDAPLREATLPPDRPIPLWRCRELLGEEALDLSDEEVDRVRRHAAAMAHVLLLEHLEDGSPAD